MEMGQMILLYTENEEACIKTLREHFGHLPVVLGTGTASSKGDALTLTVRLQSGQITGEQIPCILASDLNGSGDGHPLPYRAAQLLQELGFDSDRRCYRYLLHACRVWLQHKDRHPSVTKIIYPEVAVSCDTTAAAVERSIREGIRMVWGNPDLPLLLALFPPEQMGSRHVPTNRQMLIRLTEYLSPQGQQSKETGRAKRR